MSARARSNRHKKPIEIIGFTEEEFEAESSGTFIGMR